MIRLDSVSKVYDRKGVPVAALRGVSVEIRRGEFAVVMGPSGSGKSTLLHILGFLDDEYDGTYRFDGTLVARKSTDELAALRNRAVGFVFQSFHLLPQLSVVDNVALPALYARDRSPAACRALARKRLEELGLGDRLDHRPGELSAGQRQRAAIARALINDPRVLLADEPTGALDSHTARDILDIFRVLHQGGATIVMVTHDPEVASVGERVIHVRDGQIIHDGLV